LVALSEKSVGKSIFFIAVFFKNYSFYFDFNSIIKLLKKIILTTAYLRILKLLSRPIAIGLGS
jgi:hypothetical protein